MWLSQLSANASTKFSCGQIDGTPATMAKTSKGNNVPVIRWVSSYFSGTGWTAQARCKDVSARFQRYYDDGSLRFLTTGQKNGLPVICTSPVKDGGCKNLLFTLKSGTDPSIALQNLLNVRNRARGPLDENPGRLYVDIEELINGDSNTATAEESQSSTANKAVPEQKSW